MNDILSLSAVDQAAAIKKKSISVVEVIQVHLDRISEVNPALNAVVQLRAEGALADARAADITLARGDETGPLHGVPMTIKDSIDTADLITAAGTKGRESFVPSRDASVVARLRKAGAILLGKTNTPELTLSAETDNLVYGRTNNPYDTSRSSGGSSAGPAAIVASCGSAFDLGSDTGGSIRQPAHFCGISGLKPTSGRVPSTGHVLSYDLGVLSLLTQIGPLARSVEDIKLILSIISGVDGYDPSVVPMPLGDPGQVDLRKLRGVFCIDNGIVSPTSETIKLIQDSISVLEDVGINFEEAWPDEALEASELFHELILADGGVWIEKILKECGTTEVHPVLKDRFLGRAPISVPEYTALLTRIDCFRSGMLRFMENYDFILCPVNAFPAARHGEIFARGDGYTYTRVFNMTGWPASVVRAGTSPEGLPIGFQVAALPWREDLVLAVSAFLESRLGGWKHPPL